MKSELASCFSAFNCNAPCYSGQESTMGCCMPLPWKRGILFEWNFGTRMGLATRGDVVLGAFKEEELAPSFDIDRHKGGQTKQFLIFFVLFSAGSRVCIQSKVFPSLTSIFTWNSSISCSGCLDAQVHSRWLAYNRTLGLVKLINFHHKFHLKGQL